MITSIQSDGICQPKSSFLGLAPFLRMSIAGSDLLSVARELMDRTNHDSDNANLWMNLSTVMLCLGQRDAGLSLQSQALSMQSVYRRAASHQPAKLRLLMLMAQGDLAANTPLDCLLENSDIDLDYFYITMRLPVPLPIPDHDALIVAVGESDENHTVLAVLAQALADWPRPVINAPENILATKRDTASTVLQNIPGLLMPPTRRVSRSLLIDIATGCSNLSQSSMGCDFPIILRPVGSHAGVNLEKIHCAESVANYLSKVDGENFFMSRFIDYSGEDGLYRKFRIALIEGQAFACHMAISSDWMIHYVNAGMYEDAQKRFEEADFMAHFDDFAQRHRSALDAVCRRTKLDYFCIDCAETREGVLLVFEIDHAMVVHAMDPEELFPYKQSHMQKVQKAFRDFVCRRALKGEHECELSAELQH